MRLRYIAKLRKSIIKSTHKGSASVRERTLTLLLSVNLIEFRNGSDVNVVARCLQFGITVFSLIEAHSPVGAHSLINAHLPEGRKNKLAPSNKRALSI